MPIIWEDLTILTIGENVRYNMGNKSENYIPIVFTIICIILGACIFFRSDSVRGTYYANLISGIIAAIAAIWLVSGFFQQKKSIKAQQESINIQRKELELQRIEIYRIGKFSAMAQIQEIIDRVKDKIEEELPDAKQLSFANLITPDLKVVIESNSAHAVMAAAKTWLSYYNAINFVLTKIRLTTEMYCECCEIKLKPKYFSNAQFIVDNKEIISKIPYIDELYAMCASIVEVIDRFDITNDMVTLAFIQSSSILVGGDLFKDGVKEKLVEKIKENGRDLPAICKS